MLYLVSFYLEMPSTISCRPVKQVIQNSPAVKQVCSPQEGHREKIQGGGQELDGRLMAKNLITTIQVNLCCLLHISLGFGTKFTWIVAIRIFAISLKPSYFLVATLDFISIAFLGAAHFLYGWISNCILAYCHH